MSFLVMPSERETGEIMGGGDWANEYSYKNPSTGKWEYTRSPRIYGDNGDLTYEEWMKKVRGWEPGTYGPNASDNAYNEWLKRVTPEGKGRMNGMGEIIAGTKPNKDVSGEFTTNKTSQLGNIISESSNGSSSGGVSSSEESLESVSSSGDKGTDYSWITAATEEALPEQESEYPNGMSEDKFNDYYTFAYGMTHETPKKLDEKEKDIEIGDSLLSNKASEGYDKFIAPLEMNKAWDEANKHIDSENVKLSNKTSAIADALKGAGDVAKDVDPEAAKEFGIGKDTDDVALKRSEIDANIKKAEDDMANFIKEYASDEGVLYNDSVGLTEQPWYKATSEVNGLMPDLDAALEPGKTVKVKTDTVYSPKGTLCEVTHNKDDTWTIVTSNGVTFTGKGTGENNIAKGLGLVGVSENPADRRETVWGKAQIMSGGKSVREMFGDESIKGMIDYSAARTAAYRDKKAFEKEYGKPEETADKITPTEKEEKPIRTVKEIKEEYAKIDVSTVTNAEEAVECKDKIKDLTTEGVQASNRNFVTIYNELVNKGIKAKDLYNQPEITKYSQESFEFGQDIYEKYSELEAKTNELGLTSDKLNKKYINKNIDEITLKVAKLDPKLAEKKKITKMTGTYYSPGSDMNGTGVQPTGITPIPLSKEQVKALADYADDIQCGKDAGLAIMKSSAFNGAKNVKGGKYTEEWKKSAALEKGNFKEGAKEFAKDQGKLTWKDYFAAAVKGTLGTVVTAIGVAVAPANPVLGTLLITAGTASAGKAGLQITTDVVRSKSTNEEMMFGSGEGGKDVFRDIYNRSLEPANIGDPRSVGTYTNLAGGAVNIATGFVELVENPVVGVTAIKEGVEDINRVGNGGLRGNIGNGINNIYELGVDVSTFLDRADLSPEALGLTKTLPTFIPNVKDKRIWNGDYTVYEEDTENKATDAAASEYDSAESSEELSEEEQEALDSTYSGAKEQAKNSNLATDYNAGMEKETNEAVSDERVKGYIVKIYGSEPDYIRNAISKILTAHSEREWK